MINAFLLTNQKMISGHIDCTFSGTTCVSMFLKNRKIYTANVGDSRIVIYNCKNGNWTAKPLSIDHKPNLPAE